MTIEQMNRIAKWNLERDNKVFDYQLEIDMLEEEKLEFYLDYDKVLLGGNVTLDGLTKMVDAICDYQFVLCGTMSKAARTHLNATDHKQYHAILQLANHELNMMGQNVSEVLPVAIDLDECLEFVITANEQKSKTKNAQGKITKPEGFVPPDAMIRDYLIAKGVPDDAVEA